jgi:dTMP kinase
MEMPEPSRGMLVTLEGPDGAGKSTQAGRLAAGLEERGYRVRLVREPGGTPIGEAIRTLLLDPAAPPHDPRVDVLLFNAARAQLVGEIIRPALEDGAVVICDRFTDSTLAYQGYGEQIPLDELRGICDWATDGIRPDLTVLLDLPVEVGLARRRAGDPRQRSRFESDLRHDLGFHQRVHDGFLDMAAGEPERWRIVNADDDPDPVAEMVLTHVMAVLPARSPDARSEPRAVPARISR